MVSNPEYAAECLPNLGNRPRSVGLPILVPCFNAKKRTTNDKDLLSSVSSISSLHKSSGNRSFFCLRQAWKVLTAHSVLLWVFSGTKPSLPFSTSLEETIANLYFEGIFCSFKLKDFLRLGSGSTFFFSIAELFSLSSSPVEKMPKSTAHA